MNTFDYSQVNISRPWWGFSSQDGPLPNPPSPAQTRRRGPGYRRAAPKAQAAGVDTAPAKGRAKRTWYLVNGIG
jgi:hypothetical protein